MGEKIESMEGVLGELTGIAYCKRSSGKINTKKTAELNLADKDFYKRSMEELSADTGLNKGELLLIKRLSKK
ncbi:MAG: hypothetical protein C0604_04060 [Clostridiales bacterium]|nr:MAG: hypothetical protein C0604_04060 [Clostridiales bacterium]